MALFSTEKFVGRKRNHRDLSGSYFSDHAGLTHVTPDSRMVQL